MQAVLDAKVEKKEGWTLLSPTDQAKLAALVVEGDKVEISGSVNAENVQGLEDWINKKAGTVTGLSENNLTNELNQKLIDSLFIKTVDEKQFDISNNHLSIKAIDYSKVTGLEDILELKASAESVTNLSSAVTRLETSINNHMSDAESRFSAIEDRLTWHGLQ